MLATTAVFLLALAPAGQPSGGDRPVTVAVIAAPERATLAEPLGPWVLRVREAAGKSRGLKLISDSSRAEAVVVIDDRYNPGDMRVLRGSVRRGEATESFKVVFSENASSAKVAEAVTEVAERILRRLAED